MYEAVLNVLSACGLERSYMSNSVGQFYVRLIKKPAKTGWVYIVILHAGSSTCGLLSPQWFTPEVHLTHHWKGKNVTYLTESVLFLWLWKYTLKQMSRRTQNYTHTLFTTAPKHSSLSHILRNNISYEAHKSAMHDCN